MNADKVWALWKEWLDIRREGFRGDFCWFVLLLLLEWQFWVTGFRTGIWWGGAGSGKDLVITVVVISSLVLLAKNLKALAWFWRGIALVGVGAIVMSLAMFYSSYEISEERFRLVWRNELGFNAVITGLLVGFVSLVVLGRWTSGAWVKFGGCLVVLFLLGVALAASESRGALLAVLGAVGVRFLQSLPLRKRGGSSGGRFLSVLPVCSYFFGFLSYWFLAFRFGRGEGGELMARGSAGRLEIYGAYLDHLSSWDWVFGKGEIPVLPSEELGWLIHHPHSAYLGQLVGYGVLGVLGLLAFLFVSLWKMRGHSVLPLVVFGLIACLFDGGQMLSVLTLARWETLVVLVPLVVMMANPREERLIG